MNFILSKVLDRIPPKAWPAVLLMAAALVQQWVKWPLLPYVVEVSAFKGHLASYMPLVTEWGYPFFLWLSVAFWLFGLHTVLSDWLPWMPGSGHAYRPLIATINLLAWLGSIYIAFFFVAASGLDETERMFAGQGWLIGSAVLPMVAYYLFAILYALYQQLTWHDNRHPDGSESIYEL